MELYHQFQSTVAFANFIYIIQIHEYDFGTFIEFCEKHICKKKPRLKR